jgi:amino acid transporter
MESMARQVPKGRAGLATGTGQLKLWPLIAATFFMVSGGAYGTEEIVHGAGYGRAIAILLLTPLVWSLPTTLMVGELSSALPAEGGYYAWVRRAMGDFWGFQEAWLSLVASIFDMALYPTLFVAYLTQLAPWLGASERGFAVGVIMVAVCALLNIAGVRFVGLSSAWMFLLVSAPFGLIVILSLFSRGVLAAAAAPSASTVGIVGGLLIAMWNYMGWDSASTIAAEVDRPQRTYPRAMLLTVLIVALTYILPVAAVSLTGLPAAAFETGAWALVANLVGGPWLRAALVAGGVVCSFGMFNALVMSYSRLPLAMARDGMLPAFFGRLHPRTRAPWIAIMACAAAWAACLRLGFARLITIDVLIAGTSVVLEFLALIVLRLREPELARPFRVPGGLTGAIAVAIFPTLLLGFSIVQGQREQILGMSSLSFGLLLMAGGVLAYGVQRMLRASWAEEAALE